MSMMDWPGAIVELERPAQESLRKFRREARKKLDKELNIPHWRVSASSALERVALWIIRAAIWVRTN